MSDREYSSGSVRRIFITMPEKLSKIISAVSSYECRAGEAHNREKPKKYHQTIGRGAIIPVLDSFEKAMVEMADVTDAIQRLPENQRTMLQMYQFGYSYHEIGRSFGVMADKAADSLNAIFRKVSRWCNGSVVPKINGVENIRFYLEKII